MSELEKLVHEMLDLAKLADNHGRPSYTARKWAYQLEAVLRPTEPKDHERET